jgi:hypothetical protein
MYTSPIFYNDFLYIFYVPEWTPQTEESYIFKIYIPSTTLTTTKTLTAYDADAYEVKISSAVLYTGDPLTATRIYFRTKNFDEQDNPSAAYGELGWIWTTSMVYEGAGIETDYPGDLETTIYNCNSGKSYRIDSYSKVKDLYGGSVDFVTLQVDTYYGDPLAPQIPPISPHMDSKTGRVWYLDGSTLKGAGASNTQEIPLISASGTPHDLDDPDYANLVLLPNGLFYILGHYDTDRKLWLVT